MTIHEIYSFYFMIIIENNGGKVFQNDLLFSQTLRTPLPTAPPPPHKPLPVSRLTVISRYSEETQAQNLITVTETKYQLNI